MSTKMITSPIFVRELERLLDRAGFKDYQVRTLLDVARGEFIFRVSGPTFDGTGRFPEEWLLLSMGEIEKEVLVPFIEELGKS